MVHSYLPRIFSLRPSESQNVTAKQIKPLHHSDTKMEPNPNLTIHPFPNNNNNKGDGFSSSDDTCPSEAPNRWPRSSATWTWVPNGGTTSSDYNNTLKISNRKLLCILATGIVVILVISIIAASAFIFVSSTPKSEGSDSDFTRMISTTGLSSSTVEINVKSNSDDNDSSSSDSDEVTKKRIQQERRKASKLSWDMLNRSDKRKTRIPSSHNVAKMEIGDGDEVILPAQMVYTSNSGSGGSKPSGDSKSSTRSCCRTQKYSQVIKREGCEPLTIVNRMCFGQCVSVWVPGLFASFPVCKPSRSTWKTVTLTCGRKRDRRKRVRVERVRRCSCMEIEPTASAAASVAASL